MSVPIDERVVSNIRAAWEADPAAHKILLDAHEIETLLAVCAERDRLKREQTAEPTPKCAPVQGGAVERATATIRHEPDGEHAFCSAHGEMPPSLLVDHMMSWHDVDLSPWLA